MTAIVLLLCRREACCADLVLVLACFSSQVQVLARMRHMSWLAPLLLACCLGSPLMLQLWVQRGTGNANFAFFLGLGATAAVVLTVVEFSRAAMGRRKALRCSRAPAARSS